MRIRKDRAGNAPGYSWPNDGDVVEVDNAFAAELLRIEGFSRAGDEPASEDNPSDNGADNAPDNSEDNGADSSADQPAAAPAPKRRR